ncbi:Glycosyltransferase [Frankia canadensis]|uniref:Glycosyltransferase n=1 Tax=Frankia canadensis TaxID=1836972 RepID=A0A2I2KQB9_9ACTN|nr:glycosyltransferase [Frankia canadensis]SNQ47850.1 Glycosyltransferase [Frankia canadensis]SOU55140.1 Glycosyltransferase [Frankia canadensis]
MTPDIGSRAAPGEHRVHAAGGRGPAAPPRTPPETSAAARGGAPADPAAPPERPAAGAGTARVEARPGEAKGGRGPRRPVRVLEVLGQMNRAGVEIRAVNLLRRLDPSEFRLEFAVTSGARGSLDGEIRDLGSEVYYCRADWLFPWRFLRLVRQTRPDVVHSAVATFSGVVLALARLGGVRRRVAYFVSSADRHGASLRGRVQRAVGRLLLDRCATDILAVSEAAMRGLWREDWRLDHRCRVIYNGVELEPSGVAVAARRRAEEIAADDPDIVTLVHVARPDPLKNRARAVEVLAALRARSIQARLRLVGRQEPAETAALTALAEQLGVGAHVEFTGEVREIPRLLAGSSLLLVTSLHEGMPTVVLEALAVGTPVLSADLPGVGEIGRLLPGVTTLPLSASDAVWADTADMLTAVPPTIDQRREAMRLVRRSPFTMDRWQRDITAVWS